MIRCAALLFFLLPLLAQAQVPINKTKAELIGQWKKDSTINARCKSPFTQTATRLKIKVACPGDTLSVEHVYNFDKAGKCQAYQVICSEDTLLKTEMARWLNQSIYHWQKVNENQYVSDFDSHLMIEFPPENKRHSLTILRMDWSRELYELLMKK